MNIFWQRQQGQSRPRWARLGLASMRPDVSEGVEGHHGAGPLQGNGFRHDRPDRRAGRCDVRTGRQRRAVDRGQDGQGLWDHEPTASSSSRP
jgi:hypothetical protein